MVRMIVGVVWVGIAACSEEQGGELLFSDDFLAGYPAPNWVGEGILDDSLGDPPPAARLIPTPPLQAATVQTANPFEVGDGFVVRFSAAVPMGSAGRIFITDAQAGRQPLASVDLRISGQAAYLIDGIPGAVQALDGHDGAFHRFEFRFDPNGDSSWSRDGAPQLEGLGTSPATLAGILVDTSSPMGIAIDQVEVRSL